MMKKSFLLVVLVVLCIFGFSGCGESFEETGVYPSYTGGILVTSVTASSDTQVILTFTNLPSDAYRDSVSGLSKLSGQTLTLTGTSSCYLTNLGRETLYFTTTVKKGSDTSVETAGGQISITVMGK